MAENTTGDVIRQYDDLIKCREKLLHYSFAEEYHNVISTCLKNHERLETQFIEKENECERLKMCLEAACEKVSKLSSLYGDLTRHYDVLLKNNYAEEFLDFAMHQKDLLVQFDYKTKESDERLKISHDVSNEDVSKSLCLNDDELIRRYELLLENNLAKDLTLCDKQKETLELHLDERTNECNRLKMCLEAAHVKITKLYSMYEDLIQHYDVLSKNNHADEFLEFAIHQKTLLVQLNETTNLFNNSKTSLDAANKDNMMLNSELKKARETLNAEKLRREQVEMERDNLAYLSEKLCCILMKYQSLGLPHELNTSRSEDNRDEIHSVVGYDPVAEESLVSFSVQAENDCISAERTNANVLLPPKTDEKYHKSVPDEASISSNWRKLRKRQSIPVGKSCCPINVSKSPVKLGQSDLERDLPGIVVDHNYDYEANNVENMETRELPITLKTNENPDSLNRHNLRKRIRKSNSTTKVSSSTIALDQSHFKCDFCKKSFTKKSEIIRHMRAHMETQSVRCEKCGKSFAVKDSGQRPLKCSTCEVRYNTLCHKNKTKSTIGTSEMNRNGESATVGDNPSGHREVSYAHCDICGRDYSGKQGLKRHIRAVHNGEKPFECEICGKSFFSKRTMKKHEFTHRSLKPFKCSTCHWCFTSSRYMKRHIRVVHEKVARYSCAHCDKRCDDKNALASHIHSKHFSGLPKQFKCTVCGKLFAYKHNLKGHQSLHNT